jgi:hypothetical protein
MDRHKLKPILFLISVVSLLLFVKIVSFSQQATSRAVIQIQQAGVPQGTVNLLNCSTNVTCSLAAGVMTISATGLPTSGYGWQYTFTVHHSLVAGAETNFPVLLSGTYAGFATTANGGKVQNTTTCCAASITVPADLVFSSTPCGTAPTLLQWEFETYNATTGAVNIWVRRTLSSSVDASIYACIGNSSVTTYQATATSVWDSHYVAVFHFPDGSTLNIVDSTNTNTASNNGATAGSGQIDGAASFVQASSEDIDLGNNSALKISGPITLEAWVSFTGTFTDTIFPRIISNLTSTVYTGAELVLDAPEELTPNSFYLQLGNGGAVQDIPLALSMPITVGQIYFITGTYDGTNASFYQDGTVLETDVVGSGAIGSSSLHTFVGSWTNGTFFWNGFIDEVRISNIARASDWIMTEYHNQHSPSTFYSVGSLTSL